MKILCIGDPFVDSEFMKQQAQESFPNAEVTSYAWKKGMTREEFQPTLLKIELDGFNSFELDKEIYDLAKDVDMVIIHLAPISKHFMDSCPILKFVGACRGGTEHIDIKSATEKNIAVMNVIRNAEQTAEFTRGLMLAEVRNISRSHEKLKKGEWSRSFPNKEFTAALYELKVGLLGLGNIGKLVARKLIGMGVEVVAWDDYMTPEELAKENLNVPLVSIEEVFKTCDVISLHMRLTSETKNFIDDKYISLMKPTSYFISTARAGLLEEKSFVSALVNNKIAGAALDVFWNEPLPKDHPFLTLDNITMTSHLGGDTMSAISRSPVLLMKKVLQFVNTKDKKMLMNSDIKTIEV